MLAAVSPSLYRLQTSTSSVGEKSLFVFLMAPPATQAGSEVTREVTSLPLEATVTYGASCARFERLLAGKPAAEVGCPIG
jgi:hypothetical protein